MRKGNFTVLLPGPLQATVELANAALGRLF